MTKTTQGGARPGAGRKKLPESKKRQQIYIMVDPDIVKKLGGKKAVQQKCTEYLEGLI